MTTTMEVDSSSLTGSVPSIDQPRMMKVVRRQQQNKNYLKEDQQSMVTTVVSTPSPDNASTAAATTATVCSIASRDRKLRKRLNMIESERVRVLAEKQHHPKIVVNHHSHHHHIDDRRDDDEEHLSGGSSGSSCVSDLRRRRVFLQAHQNRPFPTPKTPLSSSSMKPKNKKIKFWDETTHRGGRGGVSSSPFRGGGGGTAPTSSSSTSAAGEIVRQRFEQYTLTKSLAQQQQQDLLSSLSFPMDHTTISQGHQIVSPRVLWSSTPTPASTTSVFRRRGGDDTRSSGSSSNLVPSNVADHSGMEQHGNNSRLDLSKDEIMDGLVYDDDEIMTPVKPYDSHLRSVLKVKVSEDDGYEINGGGSSSQQYTSYGNPNSFVYVTPPPVFETPPKSAAPENTNGIDSTTVVTPLPNRLFSDSPIHRQIAHPVTPPNAPRKEMHHPKYDDDLDPFQDLEGEDGEEFEDMVSASIVSSIVPHSPMKLDGTPITTSPSLIQVSPNLVQRQQLNVPQDEVDSDKKKRDSTNVSSTGSILWQSLFQDDKGRYCAMEEVCDGEELLKSSSNNNDNVHTTLEALADGGALQKQDDAKNTVKLFVDKYHKTTFDSIVDNLKGLTSVTTLIVCRGLDQSSSTYRSPSQMKELLSTIRCIENLESLMLLNFGPDSLMDLAMALNHHPSVYRLQIHMAEGTLNGELLGVLATSPKLTHVQVEVKEPCAIGTLMNSHSLQTLQLTSDAIELEKSHVRMLVHGLQINNILTSLDLAPTISVEHFQSLCHALKDNDSLECLRVSLKVYSEEDSSVVATALRDLFKVNTSLTTVWNFTHEFCLMDEHSKQIVLSSLKENTTVRHFKFFKEEPSTTTTKKKNKSRPPADDSLEAEGRIERSENMKTSTDGDELMGCVATLQDQDLPDECGLFEPSMCDNLFDAMHPIDCLQDSIQDIGEAFRKLAGGKSPL
eukprot:CAMPEP_0113451824 /NCGR_PEP_ID=MMETSP0014_2-20120614/6534_1 /TAXON_ID=2857 /ORGANISM="Nitzschia sp." /LENGTH=948 /DNA_ID=CAMNT_0000343185 /DNA_START=93 /DNA_END=2939 /DNA_ORIENTATION=+ /assembly_acc=CAM_ASM_000159